MKKERISPFVVIVLIACLVFQSSFLPMAWQAIHRNGRAHIAEISGDQQPSTELVQSLFSIDTEAKLYYSVPSGQASSLNRYFFADGRKPQNLLLSALKVAESALAKSPQEPSLGLRVILLRAETGKENPLAPLAGVKGYTVYTPLDAFKLPKAYPAEVSRPFLDDRDAFSILFGSSGTLPPAQIDRVRSDIARGPNMKWWGLVAMRQLALRSGNSREAARDLAEMSAQAASSTSLLVVTLLIAIVLVFAGAAVMLVMIVCKLAKADLSGWITQPVAPVLPDVYRRLGAGDLANLFLLYLLMMIGLPVLAQIAMHYDRRQVERLSWQNLVVFEIVATAILTAIAGGVTIASAFALARRRQAKLSFEIGFNFGWERFWRTFLFALTGWGASVALYIVVESIAVKLFRDAPTPANPIEALLLSAPMGLAAFVLYLMVAVIAPITEEFVFRGLFFNAMRIRYGPLPAMLLTGLAFGLMHPVGIAEQAGLCTLGAVYAWMAYRKQSMLPDMMAHAMQNTMSYSMLLLSTIPAHLR